MPFVGYPCNAFSYILHPHYYYFVIDSQADNPADIDEDYGDQLVVKFLKKIQLSPLLQMRCMKTMKLVSIY